jgi:hypothetical protein
MPINTQQWGNSQAHSESGQRDDGSVTHHLNDEIKLTEIQRFVEDADFPSDKNKLAEHARQKGAPRYIVDLLEQLQTPEFGSGNDEKLTTYNNLHELMYEIEKVA